MVPGGLEQKVHSYIRAHKMVDAGMRVLLAVSGGPDSMALLYIMKNLSERLGINLTVAHLDHGLRPGSAAEADMVASNCQSLGIPLARTRIDVRRYCREHGLGIEAGAREVRHCWLAEVAAEIGAERIATAHHRDDQAETVLLHLVRGSGIKGLGGISPYDGRYIRPLLFASKNEIISYLQNKGIDYCIDESNADIAYLRNRVRHQLIPLIEQNYNPAIRRRLCNLAEIARLENDYLDRETAALASRLLERKADGTLLLDAEKLAGVHPALTARLIMMVLSEMRGSDDFTAADVKSVLALAEGEGSARYHRLSGGIVIRKEYERLVFERVSQKETAATQWCYQLTIPGEVEVPELKVRVRSSTEKPELGEEGSHVVLARETLPPVIDVRARRRGDRIVLPAGTKKLSDWFVDHKIPFRERDCRLLLAHGGEIIWIAGGPVGLPYRFQPGRQPVFITLCSLCD